MSNINLVNVAATLNEAEINSEITKVNGFTNINQLKQFTIEKINYMEAIRERFSENALVRVAVIAVLVLVQIILYTTKGNYSFNSKTIDF
jgi:cell division protein ZapA (FtsZ GTPase activity inhibitor)